VSELGEVADAGQLGLAVPGQLIGSAGAGEGTAEVGVADREVADDEAEATTDRTEASAGVSAR
jgi:hypothetical protein